MSREKQVEEMEFTEVDILANDINQHCADLAETYCGDTHCVACLANALYNAGYRKQSEGKNVAIYPSSAFECSECHWEDWDLYTADSAYNFCPNCGAKMTRKEDEGK